MGENKSFFESLVFESRRLCCGLYGTGKACEVCFISTTVIMGSVKSLHSSLLSDEKSSMSFFHPTEKSLHLCIYTEAFWYI